MKKIDLMYFDKKNDAFFVEFVIKKCENVSLFLKKDNRLFIKSKFSPIQELKINMTVVTLDEKFSNGLIKLIYKVHDIVPTIKTSDPAESQDYSIQHPDRIEAVIFSLVNKFSYENRGILEFISLLLIRIARAHAWHNGNKRTAIVSVSKILMTFGYYIKWSNDNERYIGEWEQFMCKISGKNEYEDNKLESENILLDFVKEKLKSSIWIDIRKTFMI